MRLSADDSIEQRLIDGFNELPIEDSERRIEYLIDQAKRYPGEEKVLLTLFTRHFNELVTHMAADKRASMFYSVAQQFVDNKEEMLQIFVRNFNAIFLQGSRASLGRFLLLARHFSDQELFNALGEKFVENFYAFILSGKCDSRLAEFAQIAQHFPLMQKEMFYSFVINLDKLVSGLTAPMVEAGVKAIAKALPLHREKVVDYKKILANHKQHLQDRCANPEFLRFLSNYQFKSTTKLIAQGLRSEHCLFRRLPPEVLTKIAADTRSFGEDDDEAYKYASVALKRHTG